MKIGKQINNTKNKLNGFNDKLENRPSKNKVKSIFGKLKLWSILIALSIYCTFNYFITLRSYI